MTIQKVIENRTKLEKFIARCRKEVRDSISRGELRPRTMLFYKSTIEGFDYSEQGAQISHESYNFIEKDDWLFSNSWTIVETLRESEEFLELKKLIGFVKENTAPDGTIPQDVFNAWGDLVNLVQMAVSLVQPNSPCIEWNDEQLANYIIGQWKKDPVTHYIIVEIAGVIFLSEPLQLELSSKVQVTLRQITKEDIEQEFRAMNFTMGTIKPYVASTLSSFMLPSAILVLKQYTDDRNVLRNQIQRSIAVLRLFQPAGISVVSYQINSEVNLKHTTTDDLIPRFEELIHKWGKYVISNENSSLLEKFWQFLEPYLPDSITEERDAQVNYIVIAYRRYSDALLTGWGIEQRVTSAIMALESLFLSTKPSTELKFRLSIYAAQSLGIVNYNSLTVKKVINRGYDIRSTFAHGGQLSIKDKNKLIKDYGTINKFVDLLLDCVRGSIILMMTLTVSKEDFIDLTEDALLDQNSRTRLHSMTSSGVNFIKPTYEELQSHVTQNTK